MRHRHHRIRAGRNDRGPAAGPPGPPDHARRPGPRSRAGPALEPGRRDAVPPSARLPRPVPSAAARPAARGLCGDPRRGGDGGRAGRSARGGGHAERPALGLRAGVLGGHLERAGRHAADRPRRPDRGRGRPRRRRRRGLRVRGRGPGRRRERPRRTAQRPVPAARPSGWTAGWRTRRASTACAPAPTPGPVNGGPGFMAPAPRLPGHGVPARRPGPSPSCSSGPATTRPWPCSGTPDAFEAACRVVPGLAEWTDPDRSEPIDSVRAGAGLTNEYGPQPTAVDRARPDRGRVRR